MAGLLEWVKKQLTIKQMSQRELAKRAGVSHSLISNALRGERGITLDFCKAVAKGFNEPVWDILVMGGVIENIPKELSDSAEINSIILKYGDLTPEKKKELASYLDWLLIKQREESS